VSQSNSGNDALLDVTQLSKRFGGNVVLQGVSLTVNRGQIVGLLGPNGAGKSTLLSAIAGELRPDEGSVIFAGKQVGSKSVPERCAMGIVKIHQEARSFRSLSVINNLRVVHPGGPRKHWIGGNESQSFEVLRSLKLLDHAYDLAGALSVGQQKLLALARALIREPVLLLADEPTAGVNAAIAGVIKQELRRLTEQGRGVLLVSHDLRFLSEICDRVIALDLGLVVAAGSVDAVLQNEKVVSAYLGRRT